MTDIEKNNYEFGERLKFFRVNILKLNRKEFCEKYRIPIISVQSWENNGVRISKKQIENLETKLKEDEIVFDKDWLFWGKGEAWDILKNNNTKFHTEPNGREFLYKVESYFYEPLLKKNAVLTLDPINLKDINCPSLIALEDTLQNMHFGVISTTFNKGYVMEAFQGTFYKLIIDGSERLFLIKKMSLYD